MITSERKVISIKKEEPKKEIEKIVAKADALSGPSVLGKIDLTPKPKADPVAETVEEPVEVKEEKPVVYDDTYTYVDPEKVKMCALSFERCIGAQCNLDKKKVYQLRLK